jgi:hypothetical protein
VRRIRTLIEHAVVYDGIAGIARRVEDALPIAYRSGVAAIGTKRTCRDEERMSAFESRADMAQGWRHVCFLIRGTVVMEWGCRLRITPA